MPLRLSNIEHIPYPDAFHLYDACLNGYSQLASKVGPFSVDEDQIGVNERYNVKVWLNNNFESSKVSGLKVSESKMVNDLLILLDDNTNH